MEKAREDSATAHVALGRRVRPVSCGALPLLASIVSKGGNRFVLQQNQPGNVWPHLSQNVVGLRLLYLHRQIARFGTVLGDTTLWSLISAKVAASSAENHCDLFRLERTPKCYGYVLGHTFGCPAGRSSPGSLFS